MAQTTTDIQAAVDANQRKRSVARQDYAYGRGGVVNWILPTYGQWGNQRAFTSLPEQIPPYNRYVFFSKKDQTLMATPYYEGMWADALSIATTKTAAWNWEIESEIPLRRKRAQQVLQNATAGIFTGWVPFLSAHLRSFLLAGRAIVEIERETKGPMSRVKALHHLNPLRCQFTDDPKTPVLYYDRKGKVHELPFYSVMLFGDMADPTLGEYALVNSAAERAYETITLLAAVSRYLYEKSTGSRPTELNFIQGLTEQNLNDAIQGAQEERARQGGAIYMGAAAVPIPGDVPIEVKTVALKGLPDGWNAQELRDDGYIKYARAIGLDSNDIDPRLGQRGGLGSGAQAMILNEKSKGEGLAAWRAQWIHNLNYWVLDTATKFVFNEKSLDDETKEADLKNKHVTMVKTMIETQMITPDQGRNLLVDAKVLPREMLDQPAPAGKKLGDEDKQTEKPKDQAKMEAQKPPQAPQNGPQAQNKPQPAQQQPSAQPAQQNAKKKEALSRLKHLQGKHDQKAHGYRFGKNLTLSRARAMKKDGNWGDYRKRAEAKRAGKRPSAKKPKGVKPTKTGEDDPKRLTTAFGQDPNTQYQFKNRVVEMDDLITSNLKGGKINPAYSQELQPRDRSRVASQKQIDSVAQNLVAESLLTDFHQLDKGAPIIGGDRMVESGNGRTLALQRARDEYPEKYAEYKDKLKANIEAHGLKKGDLEGIKNPVLVRERVSNVDRAQFAKEANQAAVLQMSPLEVAKIDASKITDESLFTLEVGENQSLDQALRTVKNQGFVRKFMGTLPENERAPLMRANGTLNQMGLWRMKAAVFSKVFPGEAGDRISDTFLESLDSTTKNFENSISKILPKLAKAESLIASGNRPKVSIMNDVASSLDMLSRLRENGTKVNDYLGQMSLFERELTPRQEGLLRHFDSIGRSPVKIREFFSGYADAVMGMPPPQQIGLFGAGGQQTPDDIFAILQAQGLMG